MWAFTESFVVMTSYERAYATTTNQLTKHGKLTIGLV